MRKVRDATLILRKHFESTFPLSPYTLYSGSAADTKKMSPDCTETSSDATERRRLLALNYLGSIITPTLSSEIHYFQLPHFKPKSRLGKRDLWSSLKSKTQIISKTGTLSDAKSATIRRVWPDRRDSNSITWWSIHPVNELRDTNGSRIGETDIEIIMSSYITTMVCYIQFQVPLTLSPSIPKTR